MVLQIAFPPMHRCGKKKLKLALDLECIERFFPHTLASIPNCVSKAVRQKIWNGKPGYEASMKFQWCSELTCNCSYVHWLSKPKDLDLFHQTLSPCRLDKPLVQLYFCNIRVLWYVS